MINCRAGNCGMQFQSVNQRNKHEELLHTNLFSNAVDRMIKKIISMNSDVDRKKKVFYTKEGNSLSYDEIHKLPKESNEYKYVCAVLSRLIEDWVDNTPNTTIDDFFRRAQFKIKEN